MYDRCIVIQLCYNTLHFSSSLACSLINYTRIMHDLQ